MTRCLNGMVLQPAPLGDTGCFRYKRLKRIAGFQFIIADQFNQQRIQRSKLGVAAGGAAQVVEETRDFGAVFVFAVAVVQAGEDAGDFQMALYAHPFEPAVNSSNAAVRAIRQRGLFQ